MCIKVACSTCKKSTWRGCGLHIDSALLGVAECDRCAGWQTGICQLVTEPTTATTSSNGEVKVEDEAMPDPLTPAYLETAIQAAFTNLTHIQVEDTSDGCGSKFVALVVTDSFEGVKRLQRHRMINGSQGCLANAMKNIHALTLKLYTVKEYEKKQAKK